MEWLEISTHNCSVRSAIDVVGSKWSLLVLREMFNGVRRFDEIRDHLGISETVLARRLDELTDAGVVTTREYREPGRRRRREYVPTESGWDLFPVMVALLNWGDKHRAAEAGGSWLVEHRDCGGRVVATVSCEEHPGVRLSHRDTATSPGPSAVPVSISEEPRP